MTHDELLEKLLNAYAGPIYHALRAVVKLHKPWNFGCSHCNNIEGVYISYPCPTIQAIEKELG